MAETTLEEAKHCPKCEESGVQTAETRLAIGQGKALTITCGNEKCPWFNTGWVVQVLPDGSIPERKPGPKSFSAYTAGQEAAARRQLEDIALQDPHQERKI